MAVRCRVDPLPTYPFERKRYWVDRSETSDSDEVSTSHAPASSVEHWLFAPTWIREASRHQGNPRIDGAWLLMARPGALADAIVQHMQRAGARPIVIEPGNDFRAIDAEHYQIGRASLKTLHPSSIASDLKM